jgi:hypothetical protein
VRKLNVGSARTLVRRIDNYEGAENAQHEEEPRRIEHTNDATITFTIALHGPHSWEMSLEDSKSLRDNGGCGTS